MVGENFVLYGETASAITDEQTRQKDTVADVLAYFDEQQRLSPFGPIPARDVLQERLEGLTLGRPLEVVCFNCIDFTYQAKGGNYPQATALEDTTSAITACYKQELLATVNQLRRLGTPSVTIIVPDSELTDTNVFNFVQKETDRDAIGQRLVQGLSKMYKDDGISVMLWSDFLKSRGLPPPEKYTEQNLSLVMGKYRRSVKDMVSESKGYFLTKGLGEDAIGKIAPAELALRSAWYLAMYAGEGNAMADLGNAVMLNFENDGKVLRWSQRGAQGTRTQRDVLPIITPADTGRFRPWKEGLKIKRRRVIN